MKIPDAVEIITEAIREEIASKKTTGGSIGVVVNYNQGAINDIHISSKRKFTSLKTCNEEK